MVKQFLASIFLLLTFADALPAQSGQPAGNDPVLFTVAKTPVYVSEFQQIYAKTNQQKADFSEASLREYLDLYVKFKLKVHKAREMRLDTVEAFRSELEGYRRQLAASYLVDREVTDKLIQEAYERMKQDVDISHIFLACEPNAKASDTLALYNQMIQIISLLNQGATFESVATANSQDKSAKENAGRLGFVTALLPDGYYNLEKAIYAAKPGDLLGPVRTKMGYHLVMVHSFRPARGEIEVAQILVRKGDNAEETVKKRMVVDSVYAALQRGANWEEVCNQYSEDKVSAARGGYIGFFGINQYQRDFEDAAFSLEKDGDISKPVETSIGWHIIKRISRRSLGSFEDLRKPLTERIRRDSRSEVAKQSMIARIRQEANCREFPENLDAWAAQQRDSIFLTFKWKPGTDNPQTPLMQLGKDTPLTVADFEQFCARASRERMRGMGTPVREVIDKLFKDWSDEVAIQYEESHLQDKYPEFKALMREYEEGMLLFDAAKQEVWDRANADSTGLEQYFEQNLKGKYMWDERAVTSFYTLKSDDPDLLLKVREYAVKKSPEDVLKKFNKKEDVLVRLERLYERGKNKDLLDIWKAGGMTTAKVDANTKTASFQKIEEILPPSAKTLSEARGYAVADYQDFLEKQWVEKLRGEYPVSINEQALMSLVKKQ